MEKIELKYFVLILQYSLISGVIGAIVSLIPYFLPLMALFVLPFLGSVLILGLLIKVYGFSSAENKTFAILGGISGFFICAGFLIAFIPLVFIIHKFFKTYYDYGIQYLNLFLFLLFFIMIAMVYIVTNAVSGLLLGIIYTYFKGKQNGQDN